MGYRYIFGPVYSRRFGYSLGVNNVPYKYCSYSCIYCQAGFTTHKTIKRRGFYNPKAVVDEVVGFIESYQGRVDVVTFVPNGEPSLDKNIGFEVECIKERTSKPLVVLTNSSLLWIDDVRSDLIYFDIVSIKVDSVREDTWRKINRPHRDLRLDRVLDGIREFSREYSGRIVSETMLVESVNDSLEEYRETALFLKEIGVSKAYVAVPIRPPCEPWVKPVCEEEVVRAYMVFQEILGSDRVELLVSYEKPDYGLAGNIVDEVVRMASVHPIRLDYLYRIVSSRGFDPEDVVNRLLGMGVVRVVEYRGYKFIVRRTSV